MRIAILLVLEMVVAAALPFVGAVARPACEAEAARGLAHLADLPPGAQTALGFAIAERGAPWQAGDAVGTGPMLPTARFVAAHQAGCRLTLRYEQGGIAHSYRTAALERRDGRWVQVGTD
jgi:hypothetical protein